jgi:hypothetical protein
MLGVEFKYMESLACPLIFQGGVAVQPAENAGVVATDEEDLVAGQHLHGGDEEAVGLGEQGDSGEEFDFHDMIENRGLRG